MPGVTLTRRDFALCLGAASLPLAASSGPAPWAGPAEVHKVFLANPKPAWPHSDIDFQREKEEINRRFADLEAKHPGVVRFTGGSLLLNDSNTGARVKSTADAGAILVLDLSTGAGPQFEALSKLDKPLLLFQRPLTSWAFMHFSAYIRQGKRAGMINSSEYADLVPHLYMLRAMRHVSRSKVLVVRPGEPDPAPYQPWTAQYGVRVELPPYQEFKDAYAKVSAREAADAAAAFTRNALRIVEPKAADIQDSLRFYLAALEVLRQREANALTIDCLGGFRRGDLPACPCVAFSKLNDAGMYGVCEADFLSTMTQLLVTAYSGKPGFVSGPTFDTSRNEVIHAHCVSATRLRGLGAEPSPYILRTHMEDEKGVSMQVEMPVRETITCGKFSGPKTFLVSTGEVIANLDARRGCRTKIVTRVADARKMAEGFTGGLYRVVFYGGHAQAIERMGRLMGFKTVREC